MNGITRRLPRRLPLKNMISVLTVAIIAGAMFLTAELAAGDPQPPTDIPNLDVTPPPRPTDVIPEPPPPPADGGVPPPPIRVSGIDVPVPPGASFSVVQGTYVGDGGPTLGFHKGSSYVFFNQNGAMEVNVASTDSADFEATLNALEEVKSSDAR